MARGQAAEQAQVRVQVQAASAPTARWARAPPRPKQGWPSPAAPATAPSSTAARLARPGSCPPQALVLLAVGEAAVDCHARVVGQAQARLSWPRLALQLQLPLGLPLPLALDLARPLAHPLASLPRLCGQQPLQRQHRLPRLVPAPAAPRWRLPSAAAAVLVAWGRRLCMQLPAGRRSRLRVDHGCSRRSCQGSDLARSCCGRPHLRAVPRRSERRSAYAQPLCCMTHGAIAAKCAAI